MLTRHGRAIHRRVPVADVLWPEQSHFRGYSTSRPGDGSTPAGIVAAHLGASRAQREPLSVFRLRRSVRAGGVVRRSIDVAILLHRGLEGSEVRFPCLGAFKSH